MSRRTCSPFLSVIDGSSISGTSSIGWVDITKLSLERRSSTPGTMAQPVDTASRAVRDAFAADAARRQAVLTARLQRLGVDQLQLPAGHDFLRELSGFLRRRTRKK